MRQFIWLFSIFLTLGLSAVASAQVSVQDSRLSKIHSQIISDHPNLTHVSAAEIDALIGDDDNILLLDVREDKEFAVSHIDGALRVDPDISPADFMARFGAQAAGKQVILYCSVGRRSSKLGARVKEPLMAAGAKNVANLEGGLFRWHNNHGPLSNASGETESVHPYNVWWARLLERKEDISYKAE